MKRIAINGFGRIGRSFARTILSDPVACKQLELAVINVGPCAPEQIDHLFKYDTVMGTYPGQVSYADGVLTVDEHSITVIAECEPSKIPWADHGIDWVVECTGCFTDSASCQQHIDAGATKILISAPGQGEDITIVPGVNSDAYDASQHNIVALGSCTTNCIVPMIKVIKERFSLTGGLMTTTHAYTNTQVLLDIEDSDLRRSRAAALNIIPTSTGADKIITKIFPDLTGKIQALAIRVPVPIVSLVDFTFTTQEELTAEAINEAFVDAAAGELKGILEYTTAPLVSSDYQGHPASCIIDSLLTRAQGNMGKVFGWYDNEWGYSQRLKDFLLSA